jgi:hypothetical protein
MERKVGVFENMPRRCKISVIAPSIRPYKWMKFHKWISYNDTPFEIIFVGHVKPKFRLPSNMKFIYTKVKPAQCFHIAFMESQGDFLLNSADDLLYRPHILDNMVNLLRCNDPSKNITSALYKHGPRKSQKKNMIFFGKRGHILRKQGKWVPYLQDGAGTMISKKLWNRLGGIDRRFIQSYWDLDMAMRVYESGGDLIIDEGSRIEHRNVEKEPVSVPTDTYHPHDANLFYALWVILDGKKSPRLTWKEISAIANSGYYDKKYVNKTQQIGAGTFIMKERAIPVEPFKDRGDIMEVSQGENGKHWP